MITQAHRHSLQKRISTCPTTSRPSFFRRVDDADDEVFYSAAALVTHIDDGAIAKVGEIYAQLIPQGGAILDLMSSWRSHLPAPICVRRAWSGSGLNREEMEDNPALTEVVVHNRQSRSRGCRLPTPSSTAPW